MSSSSRARVDGVCLYSAFVPQILLTPQNVAIDQGINLRVVPTSYNTHGHSHRRPQQIYSFFVSPNLSKMV